MACDIENKARSAGFRSLLQHGDWSDEEIDFLMDHMDFSKETSEEKPKTPEGLTGFVVKSELGEFAEGGGDYYDITARITRWAHFGNNRLSTEEVIEFNQNLKAMGLNQKVNIKIIEE